MQTMRDIDSAFGGDLRVFSTPIIRDERGIFAVPYVESEALSFGLPCMIRDIYSRSGKHVLRGLHYQFGMSKMMRVNFGKALLVSVDIRPDSQTFGLSHQVTLDHNDRGIQIWACDGIARGYLALKDETEIQYKCSAEFDPELDKAYRWNSFDVEWGITTPILSNRDSLAPICYQWRQQ